MQHFSSKFNIVIESLKYIFAVIDYFIVFIFVNMLAK